jgi:teichuronic acid biosynthesis glycosyltransferase TuaG
MTPARVSIITPTKNAEEWVGEAIASVLAQSFQDWEMIVVDDRSTDATVQTAIDAAQGDPRVRVFASTHPPGAAGARNAALEAAVGRYIAFLDADDVWDVDKLAVQIDAMERNGWVFSWTSYRVETVDAQGNRAPPPHLVRTAQAQATRWDVLSKKAPIGCLTAVYDTQAFGKVPMVAIPKRQDFVLWATLMERAERNGWPMGGVTTSLATYRHRERSLSSNKFQAAGMQWQALTRHCGVPRAQAVGLFLSYAWRGISDRIRLATRTGRSPG